jgi:hypothetical protein
MLFDVQVTCTMDSDSESNAEEALEAFLKYSRYHCGETYGFDGWELTEFVIEEDSDHYSYANDDR